MTQQLPPPPSKLRKGFLIVGIVLLISGFFFFYWASRVNWDYATTYNDTVSLNYASFYPHAYPQIQYPYEYSVKPNGGVIMQPNDYLTVSYDLPQGAFINGTLGMALWERTYTNETLLAFSNYGFADYGNQKPHEILVNICLVGENAQNVTVSTATTLNHYERPNWFLFGVGVVLSSLALVPIFKLRKQL